MATGAPGASGNVGSVIGAICFALARTGHYDIHNRGNSAHPLTSIASPKQTDLAMFSRNSAGMKGISLP
jgi:hypothetical protein